MKRTLCILLTSICIFAFGSCDTREASDSMKQTDTDTSITADSTMPETEGNITIPNPAFPEETAPEETTPEETTLEETTPEETSYEGTVPEDTLPEVTTAEGDDANPPEKPDIPLCVDDIIKKLAMFESVFQEDSRGWCTYDDVMGSAVTEVLSKQGLLILAGCSEIDVLLAGKATENLRVLLEEYNDLRAGEYALSDDKYIALYQYYADNYGALTENFGNLYRSLKRLYENPTISSYIAARGKDEHYRQLVGQLYVVSTALDQTICRDEDAWQIDGKGLCDVIEEIHYFPDGNWCPEELY